MDKPKWLPRVLHCLRKAFFTAAAIIIILLVLTVAFVNFFPARWLLPDETVRLAVIRTRLDTEMAADVANAVESPQPVDIALNRSEE